MNSVLMTALALILLTALGALTLTQHRIKGSKHLIPPADKLWARGEWKAHGESVFERYPHANEATWAYWNRLRVLEEQVALRRVCTWCGKTGVPGHVFGMVNVKGKNEAWYCSNSCFRSGASYEDFQ